MAEAREAAGLLTDSVLLVKGTVVNTIGLLRLPDGPTGGGGGGNIGGDGGTGGLGGVAGGGGDALHRCLKVCMRGQGGHVSDGE